MKCRTLIVTDTFAAGTLPHLLVTALEQQLNLEPQRLQDRDNKYKDVAGTLVYKDKIELKDYDIAYMSNMVKELNKNLVYLIYGEHLSGWLFYKDQNDVSYRKIQAHTNNDTNFDVWLESQNSLWNPVDFLLEGEFASEFISDEDHMGVDIMTTLERLESKIDTITTKIK